MARELTKSTLKVTTVNIPKRHRKVIELLLDMDLYTSRSAFVRAAIKEKIDREISSIHVQEMILKILEEDLENRVKKGKYERPHIKLKVELLWETLADLRRMFPHLPDYKYINEELVL